jgi:hypothetical protein
MAMALRPFRSASRISSRKGAQSLADGARAGRGSIDPTGRSVPPPRGGRIWRRPLPQPAAAPTHGDPGGPEVAADGLPADARFRLDPPERPAELAEGADLLLFGGVQDVAHGGEHPPGGVPPATPQLASPGGRFSGVHWWPDLGVHRGARNLIFT